MGWVPWLFVFGLLVFAGPAEGGIDVLGSGVGTFDWGAGVLGSRDVEVVGTAWGTCTAVIGTLCRAGQLAVTPSVTAGTTTTAAAHRANRPVTMESRAVT
jgi:hypothetical protein